MKKLLVILAGLGLLILPTLANAGVLGSDHDLSAGPQELCFACHIPHNAFGDKLWWETPSGTFPGVMDLCYTCHDGSVSPTGQFTVFDVLKEQHATVGTDCSGEGACHDVHNQNPNGSGRFVVVTRTNNSYCETCHDATMFPGAEPLGDHTAGLTHWTNGTTFTCNQCHSVHGAPHQTTNPPGLTNPILLADNRPGAYYGAFCISCHNGTAPPPAMPGTGGVASSDIFDYAMAINDGTETKHPTTSTTGSFPVGGCDKCHDAHDPVAPVVSYLLKGDNANSAYCVSCHNGTTGPGIGANTHFTGVPTDPSMHNGLTPPLPWANEVDEDGVVGADWPGALANNMVCESCHSAHRRGWTGVDPGYFLRRANGDLNQLCRDCHTAN